MYACTRTHIHTHRHIIVCIIQRLNFFIFFYFVGNECSFLLNSVTCILYRIDDILGHSKFLKPRKITICASLSFHILMLIKMSE